MHAKGSVDGWCGERNRFKDIRRHCLVVKRSNAEVLVDSSTFKEMVGIFCWESSLFFFVLVGEVAR